MAQHFVPGARAERALAGLMSSVLLGRGRAARQSSLTACNRVLESMTARLTPPCPVGGEWCGRVLASHRHQA